MAEDPKLKEAKKLLEQIQKVYDELGTTNPFRGMDPNTVAASNKEIEKLEIALTGITKQADDLEKGFGGIAAAIGASLAEMNKQSTATNRTVKAMRGLSSIAESLKHDQSGLYELSLKELESKRDKSLILSQEAKSQAALVKQQYEGITLDKHGKKLHGAALDERLEKLVRNKTISKSELQTIQEIIAAEKKEFDILDELNAKIEERIQKEKKVNRTLGLTKVALEGLGKIPIVGPLLDTNKALDAARAKAKAGGGAFASMSAAMGSMGKSLLSSLADPLAMIGLMVKGFQMLLELGFATDKTIVSLQKSLYLSREGAEGLRKVFHSMSENSTVLVDGLNSAFVNVPNQTEAIMQLSDAMGGVSMATLKEVQSQILLTKQMGFTVEEANALYVLGRQNKMTSSEIVTEIKNQVEAYKKQSGVLLNAKKITSEVSTINGQLRLQYKNNVTQLTAAVIQSNKLGFSLKQSKDIAEGLLNFEQSIENELSAELLLGRGLNLEQARLLALNGESAKATALIAENMGGSAGFAALNVVQQDALSKALNMTSDELANSMLYQENLAQLGEEEKQRVIEQIDLLESKGNIEAAQQLQRAIAAGTDIDAALKASTIQDEFYANVEKIKTAIQQIAEGPAMELADSLSNMVGSTYALKGALAVVAGILAAMVISFAIMNPVAAMVGLGVAIGANAYMNSNEPTSEVVPGHGAGGSWENGGVIPGNSYKGDNVKANVNSGEMVITRSQQKNLFDIANGKGNNNQNSPALITAINNLASRPIHVSVQMDGKQVITGLAEFKNVQGDANRVGDFEIS
jgi:hypothetical protein